VSGSLARNEFNRFAFLKESPASTILPVVASPRIGSL
jgi:hypothetical protein